MSKITVTGQLTLTGGQLTAKETAAAAPSEGKELWAWGYGGLGIVGQEDNFNRSSPTQVGILTDWSDNIDSHSGNQSHSIKLDGSLWGWGHANTGAIGDNANANRSSPVQIGALTDWSSIFSGRYHNFAIKSGTLWGWGNNSKGMLGIGTSSGPGDYRSSPIQVGALTNWSSVSGGTSHTLGLKTNGELWVWGENSGSFTGILGLGDTLNRSSPVQIGSDTTWTSITAGFDHSLTIKANGSLWSWGDNGAGELGQGDVINTSSPVQIGNLTDWASANAANNFSLAIKTNGTLWSWGFGNGGHLGHGNNVTLSSPVQVGALTDWSNVGGGNSHTIALKTDGTLWAWGGGSNGRLGLGDTTNRTSPVQVGTDTTWTNISVGRIHSVATKTV